MSGERASLKIPFHHRKTPSKTWKNKKMHGHMGNERITTLNMLVYFVDPV
jgi:large subunit ribosomal protein L3